MIECLAPGAAQVRLQDRPLSCCRSHSPKHVTLAVRTQSDRQRRCADFLDLLKRLAELAAFLLPPGDRVQQGVEVAEAVAILDVPACKAAMRS